MKSIEKVMQTVTDALRGIPGVRAVALGGSRARGNPRPDSDIDIGIYYDEKALDLAALERTAAALDDEHRERLIAPPGEWGKWVNGGGWLIMDGWQVDFLLRDLERVRGVVEDDERGIVTANYQTGHPHAYISSMYAGELAVAKMLWAEDADFTQLKRRAEAYPDALRDALAGMFGFEAGFSAELAKESVSRDDAYYVLAHIVRSVSSLNQLLFALNRQYCLNEKNAVKLIEGYPIRPAAYKDRVDEIFALGAGGEACAKLEALVGEARALIPRPPEA